MKEKILFYTDGWFLNFGIAKYLQEDKNFDFYAIVNFEKKAKKFFLEQTLVEYKKIWFFLDHISTPISKPDIKYLQNFEKKYSINLWQLAYFDRDFLHYNELYRFSDTEILSIIEKECKFFEMILDEVNPDYLSIFLTTTHYQELLRRICKARGIKILMLGPSRFGNRSTISQEGALLDDDYSSMPNDFKETKTFNGLRNYIKKYDATKEGKQYTKKAFEEKKQARYQSLAKFFFTIHPENYKKLYYNFGRTRTKVLLNKIMNFIRKKYRYYFINKTFQKSIDETIPFIYFPLQMEPERIILMNAPYYTDQVAVITNIAKSLPVGITLLVKEHPVMKVVSWREISFYKRLMHLSNVRLIHPSYSNEDIIKKSLMVISIAGTTGLEGIFYGKPVITFTKQIYSSIPSVHEVKKMDDLPSIIRSQLQNTPNTIDLQNFIHYIEKNTFEFDYMNMTIDFAYRFGFKGQIMDTELSIQEVESFLKEYEKEFRILVNEHKKKIKNLIT